MALPAQIISNIRRVQLKEGVGKNTGKPYRMWIVNLDDIESFGDTSPQVDVDDELATRMKLNEHPELVVGKKFQLNCMISWAKVGLNSVARIQIKEFVPLK